MNLRDISLPDSITSIGSEILYGTLYESNPLNWESGLLYVGNCLIEAKPEIYGNYSIKDGTTVIADFAFAKCKSLSEITVPQSVTRISQGLFNYCYGLTEVTVPDSVTVINSGAFSYCRNLKTVNIPDSVTSIEKHRVKCFRVLRQS